MAQSNRTRIEQLLEQFAPEIRNAFLTAIEDITRNADLRAIVRALESGDLETALRAVHLDPAAYRPLDVAIAEAFEAGGGIAAETTPAVRDANGNRLVFRFDVRNPRAETFLRTRSSQYVVEIIDDQRTAIRNALRAGMEAGTNPRNVGLDIVGRIDPATGKRAGGVIGLTSTQEQYARNYRAELEAGDPAALRRTLRDKRLDARVAAAIAEGRPVDAATIEKLVVRYRASLLRLRGETIGRTEALQSLHVGQHEGYQQAIDSGALKASTIKKVWSATGDRRVRHTHKKMDGQKVPYNGVFTSPTGETLRYPGDPLASAAEIINCRCAVEYRIDFLAGVK